MYMYIDVESIYVSIYICIQLYMYMYNDVESIYDICIHPHVSINICIHLYMYPIL